MAQSDTGTEQTPGAPPAPPMRRRRVLLLALGLVPPAVAGAFVTAAVVFPSAVPGEEAGAPPGERKAGPAPTQKGRSLVELEELVTNIAGASGTRYIKVELVLDLSHPANTGMEEKITRSRALIRDRLITIFSGKSIDALEGRENREVLREEIREELQRTLFPGQEARVERVIYKNLLTQ